MHILLDNNMLIYKYNLVYTCINMKKQIIFIVYISNANKNTGIHAFILLKM